MDGLDNIAVERLKQYEISVQQETQAALKDIEKTVEEVLALNIERETNEREHYLSLYGIKNHLDPAIFDITCDTTFLSPDEVLQFLIEKLKV